MLFTTPFSLFGDDGAPLLWLVVARAGGILAFAMAFRLARAARPGRSAGVIAAVALILSPTTSSATSRRGNSEGILVALCLWAIERHLDGRRRDAFLLGIAAALLRPEVWPFIALYGALADRRDRQAQPRSRGRGGLVLACPLIVLWFVPEYFGSGDFLRAALARAAPEPGQRRPSPTHPFLEVFRRSASLLLTPPVLRRRA